MNNNRVTKKDIEREAVALGLKLVNEPIHPGDLYLAGRNTGVKVLTCEAVVMAECGCCVSWVQAVEAAYSYDGHECFKVVEDDEQSSVAA